MPSNLSCSSSEDRTEDYTAITLASFHVLIVVILGMQTICKYLTSSTFEVWVCVAACQAKVLLFTTEFSLRVNTNARLEVKTALKSSETFLCLVISGTRVTEKLKNTTWTQNPVSYGPMRLHHRVFNVAPVLQ